MHYTTTSHAAHSGKPRLLTLPDWHTFDAQTVLPALTQLFAEGRALAEETAALQVPTFHDLVPKWEGLFERISFIFGPLSNLNNVMQTEEVKTVFGEAETLYSAFGNDIGLHSGLYEAHVRFRGLPEYLTLNLEARKIIDDAITDAELAGVALPPEKKARLKEIDTKHTELGTAFANNATEALTAWQKHITDATLLLGVPAVVQDALAAAATSAGKEGYLLTLNQSFVVAVLTHGANRDLRHEVYLANITKASPLGADGARLNNRPILERLLALAHEKALLLGHANFAELSMVKKMTQSPQEVYDFTAVISAKSHQRAHQEFLELEAFARDNMGIDKLELWDTAFVREKMQTALFGISEDELRPYFTERRVFSGLFGLIERLYGLSIVEDTEVSRWHPSVRFFHVYDVDGSLRAGFYADLYERPAGEGVQKRSGAWADDCVSRRDLSQGIQVPIAYLNCNITPPTEGKEGTLTHDDVQTLFHEFGHDLHHMLGLSNFTSTNWMRVEWDAIELPSQLKENWCWEKEVLMSITAHAQTGAALPPDLCDKLIASRYFCAALDMARQIEYGLIDMELYADYDPINPCDVSLVVRDVRSRVRVYPVHVDDQFPNTFTHIFGGGYSAGYFSYLKADMLVADTFAAFAETGDVFNKEVAARYMHEVLEAAGTRSMNESYLAFRGRMPSVDALLKQRGFLPK